MLCGHQLVSDCAVVFDVRYPLLIISPNLLPIPLIRLTIETGASQICLRSAPANAQYRSLRVAISEGNHIDFYKKKKHCQTTAGLLQSRNLNFSPPLALRSICFGVPFTRQRPHSKGRPLSTNTFQQGDDPRPVEGGAGATLTRANYSLSQSSISVSVSGVLEYSFVIVSARDAWLLGCTANLIFAVQRIQRTLYVSELFDRFDNDS